jgi:ferritin-like metal-binding protein YciE
MGMMKDIDSPAELFQFQLMALRDMEDQLITALTHMSKMATSPDIALAFRDHLQQTAVQKERLDQALLLLGHEAASEKSMGIAGIINEGEMMMKAIKNDMLRDKAMLGAGRKTEHYEMVAYNEARMSALELGRTDIVQLLEASLEEEEMTDHRLATLAQSLASVAFTTR